ncbi:MAG: gluconeogenesis factor YvcK family protein [Desulfobacterales bacterium]
MSSAPKQILTIGGGSGQFVLLSGLRDMMEFHITSVVSMVDSGGSTGRLRGEFGVLPPGDLLKCVLALSPHQEMARAILLKRFSRDRRLQGHNAGNMLLTMLSRYTGSFPSGILALCEILDVRGTILPVTVDEATLVAELTDGTRIYGEKAIDVPRGDQREKIQDVFLVPHHSDEVHVYPPVIDAIESADLIILGPGDLFTSILPNLVVPGVAETLRNARAPIFYVLNLMTKYGETHQFMARDFVMELESVMERQIDGVVGNTRRPAGELLESYARQKADFVEIDPSDEWWGKRQLHAVDLLDESGGILRHDAAKLAAIVRRIAEALEAS